MKQIEGKLYSPYLKESWRPTVGRGFHLGSEMRQSWERNDATVNKIRIDNGYPIKTFRQLIHEVALVTLSNKRFEMFYRGQGKDYKDSKGQFYSDRTPRTIIYPAICRPNRNNDGTYKYSIKKSQIQNRYDELYRLIEFIGGKNHYNHEYFFSLFQHYDILPTPLIDITLSLRVAASFALRSSNTGYLFVFGLPYPNQSISHFVDLEIVLIKLQNVCPVNALRPRYQEGYLVGKYPFRPTKEGGDNLARRLIAKFLLENESGSFWDENFPPMPDEVLFPADDFFEKNLRDEYSKFMKV